MILAIPLLIGFVGGWAYGEWVTQRPAPPIPQLSCIHVCPTPTQGDD